MGIVVQKYGGSSLADADAIKRVARRIVDVKKAGHDVGVAVAAMGDTTDDLTSIANQIALGLRHYRHGDVSEALWWWQFSYVSSWGNEASAVLRALQSVVTHSRLDTEFTGEDEELAVANEMLEGESRPSR